VTELPALAAGSQDDASIVERIHRGDSGAEERLVLLFGERIRLVALARTRDRELARELTQEALMAVLSALRAGHLRASDKLAAFVYGIVRNIVNNQFRAAKRRPPTEPIEPEHAVTVPIDPIEQSDRARMVRDALGLLSADDRQIILFTLVDGLKPGEIARRLGLPDEVVRARKSRAIKRISERIAELSRS